MNYSLLFIIYLFLHLIYKLYVIIDTNEYRETEHTGVNSLQLQPSTGGLLKCNLYRLRGPLKLPRAAITKYYS